MSSKGQHVFISYKTEERDVARRVRASLGLALQCEVWWDQNLQTGGQWSSELDSALRSAAAVVVLWSKKSSVSPWVQQEAAVAMALGTFAPAMIEDCTIPAPYRGIHAARLESWNSDENHPEFVKLVQRIRVCLDEAEADSSVVEETATPAKLYERPLIGWISQLTPTQLWSALSWTVALLILAFNIGAWSASLNLPYLRDLPWYPSEAIVAPAVNTKTLEIRGCVGWEYSIEGGYCSTEEEYPLKLLPNQNEQRISIELADLPPGATIDRIENVEIRNTVEGVDLRVEGAIENWSGRSATYVGAVLSETKGQFIVSMDVNYVFR